MPRDGIRRGGRPRAEARGSSVTIWLPAQHHDYFAKKALRDGRSLSAFLREMILRCEFSRLSNRKTPARMDGGT